MHRHLSLYRARVLFIHLGRRNTQKSLFGIGVQCRTRGWGCCLRGLVGDASHIVGVLLL